MAVLTVLTVPNELLKQKSTPVSQVTEAERQLLSDMLETMYATEGCGLAAPQVGILKRMIVVDLGKEFHPEPLKMINPQIVWSSEEAIPYKAGCLSVPGQYVEINRPAQVEVTYWDENGETCCLKAEGLFAHCLHHEIDHLEGVLILDYLSPLKKSLSLKKALKLQKQEQFQPS